MSNKDFPVGDLSAVLSHQLFRALGDPTRIRLVDLLAERCRACSVSELADCLDVDLSVVSRHLALLRAAGVLRAAKQGRTVLYEIQFDALAESLRGIADALERARDDFVSSAPCTPSTDSEKGTAP
ncbi:metalloregulator ArsR/SmtB family transcription factor [Streptomyces sp. TRM 70351]|uniref:ArsR/SmtB family transcription factor n=1 Tax=Streptomyces sp. TRM 70351 TaxID=3116552 RepID=UPI002E7C506E|nr:metalloregulator ArsR/SmtB family transcription factor [Streptomyces sp. TRM 70351]MEE1928804.1 metalloregulator ArsR/SmtB family transcription factor [Streptomyces sp. TRM 70351]